MCANLAALQHLFPESKVSFEDVYEGFMLDGEPVSSWPWQKRGIETVAKRMGLRIESFYEY